MIEEITDETFAEQTAQGNTFSRMIESSNTRSKREKGIFLC
jgi:hypothetical protein